MYLNFPPLDPPYMPCQADPTSWQGDKRTVPLRKMKELCKNACPLRDECLENAMILEIDDRRTLRFGIRGGLTGEERYDLQMERELHDTEEEEAA